MASIFQHTNDRRTATLLRALYGVIALVAVSANLFVVLSYINYNVVHSDECLWDVEVRKGDTVMVVKEIVPGGSADVAGIRTGDRVLAINDQPVGHNTNVAQDILNKSPVDRDISYAVERNGRVLNLRIRLVHQIILVQFVSPIFSFLWLVMGAIVAFAKPTGRVQRRFFITGAAAIFAFTFPAAWLMGGGGILLVLRVAWGILSVSFFSAWVQFCSTFPVNQRLFEGWRRKLVLYAIVIAYAVMTGSLFLLWEMAPTLMKPLQQILGYVTQGGAILYFAAGIWLLYRGYRQLPSNADRRPTRVILIGTITAGLSLLYFTVIQTTLAGTAFILYPQLLLPVVLLLALPISFGYAIFKYQVMDLGRVIRTTLVYTITTALLAGIYLGVAWGLGQLLGSLTGADLEGTVGAFTFVLCAMLLFTRSKNILTAIENRFFPQRRDYSVNLSDYTSVITETIGTKAVALLMARTLRSTLKLNGVLVVAEETGGEELRPIARDCAFGPVYVEDEAVMTLRRLLGQNHSLISLETVNDLSLVSLQAHFSYAIGLYAQKKVIGAVLLTRPVDGDPLSGSQTPFIASVTAQGGAALELARLYEQEIDRQRMQEELATARRIQEGLLPTKMPSIPGITISALSRPAQAVGGDYYDVIRLDDHRFLVVIADVSGKGLPASLYMAEFHGMVRVVAGLDHTPKDMLTRLNDHLFEIIARGSFISATMLLFDTSRQCVTYARAGHTPILRRSRSAVDELIPDGVALGLCARILFADILREYTVEYEQGETFILYSDGVSEAMNEENEEFGDGRLHDIISSAANPTVDGLRDTIVSQIERFRGTAEQNDDITIVVVKVDRDATPTPELPVVAQSVVPRSPES